MFKFDKIVLEEIQDKLDNCLDDEIKKSLKVVLVYLERELKNKEIKELHDRITLNYVDELLNNTEISI